MSRIHEGSSSSTLKGRIWCVKCGEMKIMSEGEVCNCEEDVKQVKRDQALDSLLYERKWWEFWKRK